jgi:hypothetical protein
MQCDCVSWCPLPCYTRRFDQNDAGSQPDRYNAVILLDFCDGSGYGYARAFGVFRNRVCSRSFKNAPVSDLTRDFYLDVELPRLGWRWPHPLTRGLP